jgi:hypothetical protein
VRSTLGIAIVALALAAVVLLMLVAVGAAGLTWVITYTGRPLLLLGAATSTSCAGHPGYTSGFV